MGPFNLALSNAFIFLVRIYQVIFPSVKAAFGIQGGCRHTPSCSETTAQALHDSGVLAGVVTGIKRILSCHPFGARRL